MEGLASGKFAVCSDAGGIPEILGPLAADAGVSLPVSAGEEAWGGALTDACQRLEADGRSAGAGARRRAEGLSWSSTMDDLQRVFEEVVAG
jgi:glycosyltransferase involved in cell wall biosynthesis